MFVKRYFALLPNSRIINYYLKQKFQPLLKAEISTII